MQTDRHFTYKAALFGYSMAALSSVLHGSSLFSATPKMAALALFTLSSSDNKIKANAFMRPFQICSSMEYSMFYISNRANEKSKRNFQGVKKTLFKTGSVK